MPDIKDFSNTALDEIEKFISSDFADYSGAALKDAKDFLRRSEEDLQRWLQLVAAGQLTAADLEWLLRGKKDLARTFALKQAGVSLARLEQFQSGLIGVVLNVATTGLQQLTDASGAAIAPKTRGKTAPARAKAKSARAKSVAASTKRRIS